MIDFRKLEKVKDIINAIEERDNSISRLEIDNFDIFMFPNARNINLTEEHKEQVKNEIIRLLNEEIAELYKEFEKEVQNEA